MWIARPPYQPGKQVSKSTRPLASLVCTPRNQRAARAVASPLVQKSEASSPAAGLEALGKVRQPVLQILGGDSRPEFDTATRALDARLANGRVVVIPGARHAAHHTHPEAFVTAVTTFIGES